MAGSSIVRGRLASDPTLSTTPNGKSKTTFTVVANHRKRADDGTWTDDGDPDFYDVTTWGRDAEHVAANFHKGDLVIVTGTIRHRRYIKKDGTPGASLELSADWDSVGLVKASTTRTLTEDDPWTP